MMTPDYTAESGARWRAENLQARNVLMAEVKSAEIQRKARHAGSEARRVINRNMHGGRRMTHRQKRGRQAAGQGSEQEAGSP